ncbi:hypothetical protein QR680_017862 [Steinernema hermaphroditum]|uniref:Uncharacterized protein n=1 Tax=Steinernema hermaphroditum TaxID=289476 RepID=A0AA39HG36_9BILA|nr:hypothetical protein QR680_017862 [Steinernema hermaphroditum]
MSAEEKEKSLLELGIFRTRKEVKTDKNAKSDGEGAAPSKSHLHGVAPFATLRKIQPIVMKPLKHALHVGKKDGDEASTKVGDKIVYNVEKSVVVGGGATAAEPERSPEKKSRPSKSPSPTKTGSNGATAEDRSYQTLIMRKRTDECFAEVEFAKKTDKESLDAATESLSLADIAKESVSKTITLGKIKKSHSLSNKCSLVSSAPPTKQSTEPITTSSEASPKQPSSALPPSVAPKGEMNASCLGLPASSTAEDTPAPKRESRLQHKPSIADKLSRSFLDLTSGSHDRLQRWKVKLQNGRRSRAKDTSEPPPEIRMPFEESAAIPSTTNASGDMDVLVDWSTAAIDPPKYALPESSGRVPPPRGLHTSKSASNALLACYKSADMEHRTKREAPLKDLSEHVLKAKNLQQLVATIEGYSSDKERDRVKQPPPVRIVPFSGMKPQDSDIIRPIAFRPLPSKKASEPIDRHSITSESSSFCLKSNRSDSPTSQPQNNKRNSRTLNVGLVQPSRPKPIYQPSTSTASTSNLYKTTSSHQPKVTSVRDENDYDTVPEYLDREKCLSEGENSDYSMIYPYQSQFASNRRSHQPTLPSPPTTNKKTHHSSHHNVYGSNASNSSRNSSGIHITPSPSDSGIVDYESMMRDKDNELNQIRSTMEHNEEVVVRVYQEKERQWREQLADLKQKLQASQQGEHALRLQVQKSNEQRDQLLNTIHALTNDKQVLEKKCTNIERELQTLKTRFDQLNYHPSSNCENCARRSSIISTYENASKPKPKPPVPAPRVSKELNSNDREIRSEMDELRSEISNLKNQLHGQMNLFAEERRRWQGDRNLSGSSPNNNSHNVSESSSVLRPVRLQEGSKRCAVISQDRLI